MASRKLSYPVDERENGILSGSRGQGTAPGDDRIMPPPTTGEICVVVLQGIMWILNPLNYITHSSDENWRRLTIASADLWCSDLLSKRLPSPDT